MSKDLPTWAWRSHYRRVALRPFSNPWTVLRTAVGIAVAIVVVAKLGWNWLGLLPVLMVYLLIWCPFEALYTSRQELAALARAHAAPEPDERQQKIDAEVALKKAKVVIERISADLQRLMENADLCKEWGEAYEVSWNEFFMGVVGDPALTETARISYEERRDQFRKENAGKYGINAGAKMMAHEMLNALSPLPSTLRLLDFHAEVMLDEDRQPGFLDAMIIRRQILEKERGL